jgi:hypothetical protein
MREAASICVSLVQAFAPIILLCVPVTPTFAPFSVAPTARPGPLNGAMAHFGYARDCWIAH